MNSGLTEATTAQIRAIFSRHSEIEKAILYGSRAKGVYQSGSDIDLTLLGKNLTYKMMGKIQQELDDSLLPYQFDLSIFSEIT